MRLQDRARRPWVLPALLVALPALAQVASAADAGPSAATWAEILGPSQGKAPAPQEKVVWRSDLPAAMKEAQQSNRPLFVTLLIASVACSVRGG